MVILAAGLIVGIAMGLRQVMGLYLPPMTKELGIGREPFSMAMAVANLVWGFGAIFAGMIADRYGLLSVFWFLAATIIVANVFIFWMPHRESEKAA